MKKAFTLIELLVVIIIISLLIGLLIPVLSKVRFSSREAICRNNLKQIAVGVNNYMNTYHDLPDAFIRETIVEEGNLSYKLMPFMDSPKPSNKHQISPWACPNDVGFWKYGGSSYLYNPWLLRQNYVLPPLKIYEADPEIVLLQDWYPVKDRSRNFVRLDTSVIHEKDGIHHIEIGAWLQQYLR